MNVPSHPTEAERPPSGGRVALRVALFFILLWTTLVFLVNHRQSILLWALDRGILSTRAGLARLGLDTEGAPSTAARGGDANTVRALLEAGVDPLRGATRNAPPPAAIHKRPDRAAPFPPARAPAPPP